MAANTQPLQGSSSRPSTSHQPTSGWSDHPRLDETKYAEPSFIGLPSNDTNGWYYPSHGYDTDAEDDENRFNSALGNWGRKSAKDARWIRRGKMVPWGPGIEEWQSEERARKRLKLMLPPIPDPDEPIVLPHLRSPSPPATAPYPEPGAQHVTYTSFIMDKSVTHTYRSHLLDELEQATNSLVEGETALKRALGRLWHALGEDPDVAEPSNGTVVPKKEDDAEHPEQTNEKEDRMARAPDLTPAVHKLFLNSFPDPPVMPVYDPSQFAHPDLPLVNLEKSLATLRELQDDGREYVERLEEIRESLGGAKTQRDAVWTMVRERALKELQDAAAYAAAGVA